MARILVAGETLIDFLPGATGPLSSVESFTRRPGGAPANVAVALARLGEVPLFWTRVGDDPFGDFLVETLTAEGLPDRFVERDPAAKTGLAFVSLDEDAERTFSFYHDGSAETRLDPGRVPDEALASVEWVHFDGLSLDARPARDAVLDLASRASEAGCTVSFDPNARPERWTRFSFDESVRRAFGLADVVKATPEDLAEAGHDPDADPATLAAAVHEAGPHTVLVTLGSRGSYLSSTAAAPWGEATVDHPGYDVDPVDTTGAGDAFLAGAMVALADGTPPAAALSFADAVAAVATTAAGAMTALPDREAVEAFRESRADST
jgi:fructokinase